VVCSKILGRSPLRVLRPIVFNVLHPYPHLLHPLHDKRVQPDDTHSYDEYCLLWHGTPATN
jgi:hypothetical protein